MNEMVPPSARALGRIRHPALGPKRQSAVQKFITRTEQSSQEYNNRNALNVEPTMESRTSKRINGTDVALEPFSRSWSSANSVSTKRRSGQLRWSRGNNNSYAKPSIDPALNVVTGIQFHAITRGRDPFQEGKVTSETAHRSYNENGSQKSDGKKWATGRSQHSQRGRAFAKLSRNFDSQWPTNRNYLEDGDYVKGRGHRIDTGPLSRPVSGWLNRESRNAVELAEQDNGQGGLGRYYSLDVNTGAVTARQLTNGETILLGVNGRERKQANGGRCDWEDEEEEELDSEDEDDEMLTADAEAVSPPSLLVPLCWHDQFMKPKIKVVEPRLPSAQPSSDHINETKPVVFSARGSLKQMSPPSLTTLHTPTKENYLSMSLQKRTTKKKQQNVKFGEFPLHSTRSAIHSTASDGEENLESFRHRSPLQSGGTWSTSFFPTSGNESHGSRTELNLLTRSHGRHGDTLVDMIIVGNARISPKTAEVEKSATRLTGVPVSSEKRASVSVHHRKASGAGREPGSATPREVSIINIVQPMRTKGEMDAETTEAKKTSERANDSAIRLRYSNLRATTAVRRGHPPEGLHKKGMVRSASVGEGRLMAVGRENSGNDWNLNCISIKSALPVEPLNKTGEWAREYAPPNGIQSGGSKEREGTGKSDLSQAFDVVQLSPIRVKTATQQTRNTDQLNVPYTEINNNTTSEISSSSAPPPSRAATPNVKSNSAKSVSIYDGKTPWGGDEGKNPSGRDEGKSPSVRDEGKIPSVLDEWKNPSGRDEGKIPSGRGEGKNPSSRDEEKIPSVRDEGKIPLGRDAGEAPSARDSRKGAVILHVVPTAAMKSQVSSECDELPRSPEVEEEKSLRQEESFEGEEVERGSERGSQRGLEEALEERMASEIEFGAEQEEVELGVRAEEEQIERQSPVV